MKKYTVLFVTFLQIMYVNAQDIKNADSLIYKSFVELVNNNIQTSLIYAKEAVVLQEEQYGTDSKQYDDAVSNLAFIYAQNNEYDEALKLRLDQLERAERIYGKESVEYAEIHYNLSHCYHMLKNYQLAIEHGELAASIYKQLKGLESKEYDRAINLLAFSYMSNEDYEKIIPIKEEQRHRYEQQNNTDSIDYGDILIILCQCYLHNGNSEDVFSLVQQALDLYEKNAVDALTYELRIMGLTTAYMQKEEYNHVISIRERQLKYLSKLYGNSSTVYGDVLLNLCSFILPQAGEERKTIDYGLQALEIFDNIRDENNSFKFDAIVFSLVNIYEKSKDYNSIINILKRQLIRNGEIYGTESVEYASVLEELASYYYDAEDNDNALEHIAKAITIIEKEKGNKSKEYIDAVSQQTNMMKLMGKHDDTKTIGVETLKIKEELLDVNASDYIESKYDIAREYADYDKVQESVRIVQEIISYLKEQNIDDDEYARALETLADYQYRADDFTNCFALYKEALTIREKNKNLKYVWTLTDLSKIYHQLGQYTESIEISEKALNALNTLDTSTLNSHETELVLVYKEYILNSLAGNYEALGNKRQAGLLKKEVYKLMETRSGEQIPELVWKEIENDINGVEEEIALTKEGQALLLQITKDELQDMESYGKIDTRDYAYILGTGLGSVYLFMKEYETAKKYILEGLLRIENILGRNNLDYEHLLEMLAFCQQGLNNNNEAINTLKEALVISTNLLPDDHPDNLSLKTRIAVLEYSVNSQNAVTYAIDATEGLQKLLLTSFAQLTTVERNLYWNKFKQWFFDELPNIAYKYDGETMSCTAYNGVLLSKGLLINSEIEMSRLIAESRDDDLLNKYYKLCISRSTLNNIKKDKVDSLESVITEIEKDLLVHCKAYGDYMNNLAVTWQQVQQKLGENDVAVEFVSFPHTKDSTMYVAYILKPNMEAPQMVSLFEAKELTAIHNYKYYTTPEVSKLVWGKLNDYLNGCNNIYFAPVGRLYNIALESLPNYNGDGLISDRYNMYRLSSTRELAVTKDKNIIKEAALYGGLKYDTDTKQMEADSKRYQKRGMPDFELFNIADSLNLRSGASYLPATKIEAENINTSLKKAVIQSSLFTDTLGTEASFKNLSGKKMNLLHIATHGFYWNEQEAQQNNNMSFLMLGDDKSPRYVEDKALTRSGLLFSGANNALTGKTLPENVEDGILTAKEISTLDLRGLDLVVLSACQTGLGEITGDGVFGLQRGFKKAGANTLMMSLWKVDDNATQLLMSRFYENLIAGKSKYASLRDAQRYVREYDPDENTNINAPSRGGDDEQERREREEQEETLMTTEKHTKPYQSPQYWAAFILLDALN